MAWATSYTITDQASIAQTWNRREATKDYAVYVNDTARALGTEEIFEFRASRPKPTSLLTPGLVVDQVRWNMKFSSRIVATDHAPKTVSWTVTLPKGILPTASRIPIKNALLVLTDLTNSDAERDDIADGRTQ